jgi:hypothetical protein
LLAFLSFRLILLYDLLLCGVACATEILFHLPFANNLPGLGELGRVDIQYVRFSILQLRRVDRRVCRDIQILPTGLPEFCGRDCNGITFRIPLIPTGQIERSTFSESAVEVTR